MSTHPLVAEYAKQLQNIVARTEDEDEIISLVSPLAKGLALNPEWIENRFFKPDSLTGFSAFLLHEENDHSLGVFAVSWVPGMGVEPHDHGTWAVVAGVRGDERNISYKRTDDRSSPEYAELEVRKETIAGPGDLVCMRTGGIHAVKNDSSEVTVSLHTYGRHVNYTDRSQFNLNTNLVTDFKVDVQ
jgi:predicted metal-dependent enzyme (double-stranded beta helix superfamily)